MFISLTSCGPYQSVSTTPSKSYWSNSPPSATRSGPRTIILDGDTIYEKDVGGFKCWYCNDFIDGGKTLVEVGIINDSPLDGLEFGFVLYDGGYIGDVTMYRRTGLEHRWDWGPNLADYSFVIKTDGTGAYYDFTAVEKGESTKPNEIYKCYER